MAVINILPFTLSIYVHYIMHILVVFANAVDHNKVAGRHDIIMQSMFVPASRVLVYFSIFRKS